MAWILIYREDTKDRVMPVSTYLSTYDHDYIKKPRNAENTQSLVVIVDLN